MKNASSWRAATAAAVWAVMVTVTAAPAARPAGGRGLEAQVNDSLGLARSRVFALTVHEDASGDVAAVVEIDGLPDVLVLTPHTVRSGTYTVLAQGADGRLVPVKASAARTMRGELLARPGSRVAASWLDDGLHARILLPAGRELWLEPVGGRVNGAPAQMHVLYDRTDVLETGATCGLDALDDAWAHHDPGEAGGGGGAAAGFLYVAELACDADYEYYLSQGSSESAVEARINQVINAMNLQYEMEVGITHTITTILVRTSASQPYTSTDPDTLLHQFRDYWNANHGGIQRDVAQLFTGKDLDGGTIGIAWRGVVCNVDWAFNVVESDYNGNFSSATDLSAHELGHNWNADHCSCTSPPYTMNPVILGANTFNPVLTIPVIIAYRDSRSCLDVGPELTGGCCVGTACSVETEPACLALDGIYLGDATDCAGDPCTGTATNFATADYETIEGGIDAGSYLDTHAQDDVHEVLAEAHTGGPKPQRRSLLSHTWTFEVVAGASYSFSIDAYHDANAEGDDFVVSYSLDNVDFTDMLTVTKTADDDALQTYSFGGEIAGTVYVRVIDTDQTPGNWATDVLYVDEMFITSVTGGPDVTAPPAPTGLTASAGDGVVALDWNDSPASDLDGYVVHRSVFSGGSYSPITGVLAVSSYDDLAVLNGTTYYYVVTAVDLVGNESDLSAEVSATPQPQGNPEKMLVRSIEPLVVNVGGGDKRGVVHVLIHDDLGNPVADATVTGSFTGDFEETIVAVTGADGVATLQTSTTARGGIDYTFCVDNVTHATLIYQPEANGETCDSV